MFAGPGHPGRHASQIATRQKQVLGGLTNEYYAVA
jgi:hypothetical protein